MQPAIFTTDMPECTIQNSKECIMISKNPRIWHKIRYSEMDILAGLVIPYTDDELIDFLKKNIPSDKVEIGERPCIKATTLVPCMNLFLNNNGISRQVPMHHVYYTDNAMLVKFNVLFNNTTLKLADDHMLWDLQKAQQMILVGKDNYGAYLDGVY